MYHEYEYIRSGVIMSMSTCGSDYHDNEYIIKYIMNTHNSQTSARARRAHMEEIREGVNSDIQYQLNAFCGVL